jgi:hypothetical protein
VAGGRGCARTGRRTTMPGPGAALEPMDVMAARYDPGAAPGRPPPKLWTTAPARPLRGA